MERQVIVSLSENPFWNLAAEEHLFNTLLQDTCILLLYTNAPVIVIGKHQNPWLEVNIPQLMKRKVPLIRRISGGGAVYHDRGNLNFSFLGPKAGFDRQDNLRIVRQALLSLGIQADIAGVADLYVDGKKMSGNAYCFRKDRALHHGTLLIDADLSRLNGLLTPVNPSITTHAVRSNPAETVNLVSFESGITRETLVTRLTEVFFGRMASVRTISPEALTHPEIAELEKRNETWEWNFGRTPEFSFNLGGLTVVIRKGRIHSFETATPGVPELEILKGVPFCGEALAGLVAGAPAEVGEVLAALQTMAG